MIKLKSLLFEHADLVVNLTKEDAQEIIHKLGVLFDTPELYEEYGLTEEQINILLKSVPLIGGYWNIPEWGLNAVKGEMEDHINVLRDIARDAYNSDQRGQSLRINKQAMRLEKMFGIV
jgi:hypothetical protein